MGKRQEFKSEREGYNLGAISGFEGPFRLNDVVYYKSKKDSKYYIMRVMAVPYNKPEAHTTTYLGEDSIQTWRYDGKDYPLGDGQGDEYISNTGLPMEYTKAPQGDYVPGRERWYGGNN